MSRSKRLLDRPLTSYYLVLGAGLLLIALGLMMVFSASLYWAQEYTGSIWTIFVRQAQWAVVGFVGMAVAAHLPPQAYRAFAYPGLLVALVLLALVPIVGEDIKGNQNWLNLGAFRLQPSEFAKLALIVWGADLLTRKRKLLNQWKHLLVPLVPVAALLMLPVVLGRDAGTVVILMAILLGLLWITGAPLRLFAGLAACVGAGIWYLVTSAQHRAERFQTFLDPFAAPRRAGYQPIHGLFALGSGGLFGQGIGAGAQKWGYLPEAHTDFIFAVIGEELGLVGTLAVLALFATLGYAGLRIAGRTRDSFVRLAAGGITTWLMAQTVVNIGGVIGVLPVAGLPLPFVSYGGSALLTCMFALGMLLSFAKHEPGAQAALAARGLGLLPRTLSWLVPHRKKR
ncbi:putative lipid II flippase FtsW [Carbonactinospora thermoautotrophica]|uniref:putative lipid II flippase FtsW n=1 Tax=Carbonactinospora thermoautotrophica TaxID=1469144 RepID=UPI0011465C88|nr:putative lipid II flippase FtsW [Carbonactinospora thermoautotrophica]